MKMMCRNTGSGMLEGPTFPLFSCQGSSLSPPMLQRHLHTAPAQQLRKPSIIIVQIKSTFINITSGPLGTLNASVGDYHVNAQKRRRGEAKCCRLLVCSTAPERGRNEWSFYPELGFTFADDGLEYKTTQRVFWGKIICRGSAPLVRSLQLYEIEMNLRSEADLQQHPSRHLMFVFSDNFPSTEPTHQDTLLSRLTSWQYDTHRHACDAAESFKCRGFFEQQHLFFQVLGGQTLPE